MANQSSKIDFSLSFAPQSSAPTNPYVNEVYNDATLGLLVWNGSSWVAFGSGAGSIINFSAALVTGASVPANTNIIYDTVLFDTNSAYNSVTGGYVAPITGKYQVGVTAENPGGANVLIAVNGTQLNYIFNAGSGIVQSGTTLVSVSAGDVISVQPDTTRTFNGGTPYQNLLSVLFVG